MAEYSRCYAEISLEAVRNNVKQIRSRLPEGTHLICVVKADAYGHGAVAVAGEIKELTDSFAVAELEEAVMLRKAGIENPIMILGYTSPRQYERLTEYRIMPSIYSLERAKVLSEVCEKTGRRAKVHIALDTGMTRIGFRVNEESADVIREINELPGIEVNGIFTHLSCADMASDEAHEYTREQIAEYDKMLDMLAKRGVEIPLRHCFNSAAIMSRDPGKYNCFRAGIIIYGMYPSDEVDKSGLELTPALSLKAHIINIAETEGGRGVSYGADYVTKEGMTRIATVCAGYADGYHRSNSGRNVIIRGKYAPVIGRICMDQFMVDITDIPEAQVEDTVTLIGKDGDAEITAAELAGSAGTINYEVTCALSDRVKRIYL